MNLETLRRAASRRFSTPRAARRATGFCEHEILASLREPGCPICRIAAQSEPHYLFWLLHEGGAEPDLFDALTASLGFCPAHGAAILREGDGATRTALMHEVVSKRLLRTWRDERRNRAWSAKIVAAHGGAAACPVCRARDGAAQRAAFFLGKLIETPTEDFAYGRPGLVCAPHLALLAPHLRSATLERLLGLHRTALARMAGTLAEAPPAAGSPSDPPPGEDDAEAAARASAQRAALHLAVGHAPAPSAARVAARPAETPPAARRPAEAIEALIGRDDACAVCRVVARAREEWVAWLDAHAGRDEAIDDLLPVCRDHAWGAWEAAGPALRAALAANALHAARRKVDTALKFLDRKPPALDARRPLASLAALVRGRRYAAGLARASIARAERCPLCARLDTARDRALSLLFALLEERRHRDAFEAGYGLCLKHFARALALGPEAPVRDVLMRVETAKLARLAWALDEHARKAAWQTRPETPGQEKRAPVAAMYRFASWGEHAPPDARPAGSNR